jgi:cobalt-precorrin-5B (C1)-methyltransferase
LNEDGSTAVEDIPEGPLRRGWTTGSCATAAARAAFELLLTGECPATATITLPSGAHVDFAVAMSEAGGMSATAGVIKDAGDDPDVTHGALVKATVRRTSAGTGVSFRAGEGVGTVTKPGLPLPPGEPAINPVPRQMIAQAVTEFAKRLGVPADVEITISIPGGVELAARTLNARLGVLGGLSILGTTGIVVPYSCASWIHAIHRGIDVARAAGLPHIAGSTGSTSEQAVQKLYGLPETALIDMGDFAGGMLKHLKRAPVAHVTIAGGFAKMCKLGQGLLDLHSKRGAIDPEWLARLLTRLGASAGLVTLAGNANTAQQVLAEAQLAGLPLADHVAEAAWITAAHVIAGTGTKLDVVVFDRAGALAGRSAVRPT